MNTYLLYLLVAIVVFWLSVVARKTNNKRCIYIVVIILSFLSGLRADNVGIDTENYIRLFDLISVGNFEQAYGLEVGFKYFAYFILSVFKSNTILLLIIALLTNVCVILRMWDFKNIAVFEWMVICYYVSFYFMTMNILRQFCAVAIVFYLTRYLMKRKYFMYLFSIVITAMFMHKSALLGLLLLGLEVYRWKILEKDQKRFLKFLILVFPIIVYYGIFVVQDKSGYFSVDRVEYKFGFMLLVKLMFVILTTIVLYKKERVISDIIKYFDYQSVRVYYIIGILLTSLGYILPFMDRVGLYFYVFEGVYIGMIMNNFNFRNKLFFGSIISLLFGYIFVMSLVNDGQGVIPYEFM